MNIERIVEVINEGGLVISPTDTVYGIMGDALNEESIRNVYELKHRDYKKPLILLFSSIEMIKKYIVSISDVEIDLIEKFHPMTILLKRNNLVFDLICNGGEYVGVRIPDNIDLLNIINNLGRPVFSTSCNISGNDVVRSIDEVDKDILSKVDYVCDGGVVESVSSTVIRVDDHKLIVLREGDVTKDIKSYLGEEDE